MHLLEKNPAGTHDQNSSAPTPATPPTADSSPISHPALYCNPEDSHRPRPLPRASFTPLLHLSTVRLYPHFLHAPVARERGRGAGEARVLDAQAVLRLGLLQAGPEGRLRGRRGVHGGSVRAQGRGGRVHGGGAAVRRGGVRLAAGVRH